MRHIFRSRPVLTEATHRTTMFEIFFDLVLVLALIRLVAFMGNRPRSHGSVAVAPSG